MIDARILIFFSYSPLISLYRYTELDMLVDPSFPVSIRKEKICLDMFACISLFDLVNISFERVISHCATKFHTCYVAGCQHLIGLVVSIVW